MKACVVLVALFSAALSGPVNNAGSEEDGTSMEYFLVETIPGVYVVEDLVNAEVDLRASASDITYHYYSRNNPSQGTDVKISDVSVLRNTEFRGTKETLFIIHGWKSSNESAVNYHIREAILSKHDINLFVVDWSPVAGKNYISAQRSVSTVGEYVAEFVSSLVSNYGLTFDKIAFVGHSLGAHVSGNAGAALNGQVDHIVGLDPALPLFSSSNINNRLDPTDAVFVEIIHTNGGLLGFKTAIGHSDYYPNGGSSQPGCGLDLGGACSHSRAYEYYAESVEAETNLFVSTECSSYSDFTRGRCDSNTKSLMGGYSVDTSNGIFYLTTNRNSPYAQG